MILILIFCLLFVCLYDEFKRKLDFVNDKNSVKKLSWFLTSLVSLILSVEGTFYTLPSLLSQTTNFSELVLSSSQRASMYSNFFISFCIIDLLMGMKDYEDNFSVFEGYCHHIFYIALLTTFIILECENAFLMFLWCEIPTFIMSLSKLGVSVPRWLFSISYLLFRVILFNFAYFKFFSSASFRIILLTCIPSAVVWIAHMWWGYKIIKNM